MKRFYLAYGSNLNVRQMRFRCPGAKVVGVGTIPGYQLLFKGSKTGSYLTIEPKEGSVVPVAVWMVDEENERRLDAYEGFPSFYYKAEMPITYIDRASDKPKTADAFVYIMHEDRPRGVPTKDYLFTCLAGYQVFDFDPVFLIKAYNKSTIGGI